jgi:hypothetical protein
LLAGIAHTIAATRYGDAAVTAVVVTALVGTAGKARFATFLPGIPLAIATEWPVALAATRTLVAFLIAGARKPRLAAFFTRIALIIAAVFGAPRR